MTKRSKAIFAALFLLLLAGICALLLIGNREGFTGSRVKNPDAYLLDIEKMNGTDLHTLALQEGAALQAFLCKIVLNIQTRAPGSYPERTQKVRTNPNFADLSELMKYRNSIDAVLFRSALKTKSKPSAAGSIWKGGATE